MSKTYKLKPWEEVENHHFITKARWEALMEKELEVEFLDGFLSSSAVIYPKGERATFGNIYIVDKSDLIEICDCEKCATPDPTATPKKKKTYTKSDIRKAATRVVSNPDLDEDDAIASAVALARLIKELN